MKRGFKPERVYGDLTPRMFDALSTLRRESLHHDDRGWQPGNFNSHTVRYLVRKRYAAISGATCTITDEGKQTTYLISQGWAA